jgi:type III restriction enzyme
VIEVKGFRGEDAEEKANTMNAYWVPGVNNLQTYGRWAFGEFTDVWEMEEKFGQLVYAAIKASNDV